MTDITITEEPADESGDVLAEAAVMSAAVAGHAEATAAEARAEAAESLEDAEHAEAVAQHAASVAESKPDAGEVEQLVELKVEDAFGRLADLLSERMTPPAAPAPAAEPPKDVAPASVRKSRKRKTWAERYYGVGGDDD